MASKRRLTSALRAQLAEIGEPPGPGWRSQGQQVETIAADGRVIGHSHHAAVAIEESRQGSLRLRQLEARLSCLELYGPRGSSALEDVAWPAHCWR